MADELATALTALDRVLDAVDYVQAKFDRHDIDAIQGWAAVEFVKRHVMPPLNKVDAAELLIRERLKRLKGMTNEQDAERLARTPLVPPPHPLQELLAELQFRIEALPLGEQQHMAFRACRKAIKWHKAELKRTHAIYSL